LNRGVISGFLVLGVALCGRIIKSKTALKRSLSPGFAILAALRGRRRKSRTGPKGSLSPGFAILGGLLCDRRRERSIGTGLNRSLSPGFGTKRVCGSGLRRSLSPGVGIFLRLVCGVAASEESVLITRQIRCPLGYPSRSNSNASTIPRSGGPWGNAHDAPAR
jgi:hypothetical protein